MKAIIKQSLKQLVADRYLLALVVLLVLLSVACTVNIGLSIHSSELQLVSHYSAFGISHLYRDQWFYLLVFAAFTVIVAILHIVIAVKLLVVKSRSIATMFAWFGIGIILLGWVTASAVLNVWTPL